MYNPLWSHDGQHLAALDSANERLVLIDLKSGQRTAVSPLAVFPVWSPDSQYLYYGAHDHQIFRVRVADGHEEKVTDVSFRAASGSFGVAPDGTPLILREHGHYDVYALTLAAK